MNDDEAIVAIHLDTGECEWAQVTEAGQIDIPLSVVRKLAAWLQRYDARPELAHVVAETAMRGVSGAAPSPGRAQLERLLDAEVPSLDAAQRRAVIVALSHLDSAATWVTFRREFGMDRRDIADAAAWAAEAVLDSIRDRVAP